MKYFCEVCGFALFHSTRLGKKAKFYEKKIAHQFLLVLYWTPATNVLKKILCFLNT
jgi:hypothetical protein